MRVIEYTVPNMDAIYKISNVFNMMKDCEAGYTTRNDKEMILNIDGINYRITIDRIIEGKSVTELVDDVL